jgi:hypothetical protein
MNEIANYFERKGIKIWSAKPNDVEGAKDDSYFNIIKNDKGYLVICSIRGTPRFAWKQLETLDELEIRRLYNNMKHREIYRVPDMSNDQYDNLRFPK